ncbi:hypothetical protein IE53DRAFT_161548 [Violaceomyces palustris]|uniref:Uncharacterized protein n=1 Tax=Violaceomyces palustris TaxID=1673888 RepID=A0ACD0P627_9BASI|nr:hypothetical protein IE53DRAFT_161548 [Violaceomyces palustris]
MSISAPTRPKRSDLSSDYTITSLNSTPSIFSSLPENMGPSYGRNDGLDAGGPWNRAHEERAYGLHSHSTPRAEGSRILPPASSIVASTGSYGSASDAALPPLSSGLGLGSGDFASPYGGEVNHQQQFPSAGPSLVAQGGQMYASSRPLYPLYGASGSSSQGGAASYAPQYSSSPYPPSGHFAQHHSHGLPVPYRAHEGGNPHSAYEGYTSSAPSTSAGLQGGRDVAGGAFDYRAHYFNPFDVKHRRRTTKSQFRVLEGTFKEIPKPNAALRKALSTQLDMPPRAVQVRVPPCLSPSPSSGC